MNAKTMFKNLEYDQYWVQYLNAHSSASNRLCHYVGTLSGVIGGISGIIYLNIVYGVLIGIILSSVAFLGHFVFEKNTPVIGKFHIGIMCDFLMLYLFVFNRPALNEQLNRIHSHGCSNS